MKDGILNRMETATTTSDYLTKDMTDKVTEEQVKKELDKYTQFIKTKFHLISFPQIHR